MSTRDTEDKITELGASALKLVIYFGSGLTIAIALLTCFGWLTNNLRVASFTSWSLPMAPVTAFGFLLATVPLLFTARPRRHLPVTIVHVLVTLFGLYELAVPLWSGLLPLKRLVFVMPASFHGALTSRMSALTAVGFLLVGLSRIAPSRNRIFNDIKGLAAAAAAGLGVVFMLGYLYGQPLFYSSTAIPVALSTAVAFVSLGTALVAACGATCLPLRAAVGSSARARMLRAFLPGVPVAVLVDALIEVALPISNPAVTLTLFGLVVAVIVTGGVFAAAHALGRAMDRTTNALAENEAKLRAVFNGNRDGYLIADNEGILTDSNPAACYLFGLARHDLLGKRLGDVAPSVDEALWSRFLRLRRLTGELRLTPEGRPSQDLEYSLTANVLPGQHLVVLRDITESKRRTLESERLAAIVGSSFDAIYSKNLEGAIVSWNPGARRIFGYSDSAIIGKNEDLLYPPDERQRIAESAMAIARGEASERPDIRAIHADGHDLIVSLSESPIWGADGSLVGRSVIVRDMTAHREAEQALRESEERLRAFFNSKAVGIVFADTDGLISDANDAFLDLFGYTRRDLQARALTWSDITPDEYASYDRLALEDARRHGACRPYEKQQIRKDGSRIWVLLGFVLLEPDRKRSVTFVIDIDEKKRTEEALQKSEQRFSLMFQSSPVAMALSETDTSRVIDVNDRWCRFFEYSREEAIGRTARDLNLWVNPAERTSLVDNIGASGIATVEGAMQTKSGERRYALISMTAPILTAASESVRIVTVIDVTARRELEAQLNQSQKMEAVGRLAGGVAHDFNNMLGVILGFAELLDKDAGEDDRKKIEQIIRAGRRAAGLTNQLLAFSRKQLLEPKIISLNELVAGIATMLRRLIGEDIRLETVLDPALGAIRADPGQLEQVIMNLAVNSRDAMPDGGILRIQTENTTLDKTHSSRHEPVDSGSYVMLSITDTGTGMGEETLEHLFEPFFTTKEQGKGTGLGLSTAYGIIRQSSGHVRVSSRLGKGTTFEIYFPRLNAEAAPPEKPAPPGDHSGTETILLAEDEQSLREMFTEVLSRKGYTVIQAEDGAQAVEMASKRRDDIQLLITDIVMPGMGGSELAATLVKRLPDLKVLFISGYTADTPSPDDLPASKTHFLSKPFSNADLLEAVRLILDGQQGPSISAL